jgi:hypothetical protein
MFRVCNLHIFNKNRSVDALIQFLNLYWVKHIEIIDIECILLSFLSEKFVSTKWRIYKGILVGPRLLRRGVSRDWRECELFFQLQSLQKFLYRDLKWKKCFTKKKKCLKTHSIVGFFTKSNSSEQNICRNRRLKINFQRCCASQNKTRKIKTNSNSIGMFYKYFNSFII